MHHLLRERMRLLPLTALLCALFLLMVACAPAHRKTTPDAGLELRLLHVNDTHAFLAGIDEHMNACFEAADCRGGLARISAAIQTARQEQDNVIALDAGDQFQGTLFYSVNKWPVIAAADALLPYDAMTLGNRVRRRMPRTGPFPGGPAPAGAGRQSDAAAGLPAGREPHTPLSRPDGTRDQGGHHRAGQ